MGKAYGSYGDGLPIAVSLVAILMGLNLLQVGCGGCCAAGLPWRAAASSLPGPGRWLVCAHHLQCDHLLYQLS